MIRTLALAAAEFQRQLANQPQPIFLHIQHTDDSLF